MIVSQRVRDARKKQQLERLEAKKSNKKNSYAKYYTNMPAQIVKAKEQEQIRNAREDLKLAVEDLQIAEIDGENLLTIQEKAAVAALVLQKLEDAQKPNAQVILTASGGL